MSETEVIFVVRESPGGGYEGYASSHSFLVQADTIEQLRKVARRRVRTRFGNDAVPVIKFRHTDDEILAFDESPLVENMAQTAADLSSDGKELALAYFNHVETQVSLAATTAYLTLVADTILINAYVTVFRETELSRHLVWWAGGFLCLATLCALIAVIPHMKKKSGTVFYFRTVANMSDAEYLRDFGTHDQKGTLYAELLKQVRGKCRHLRWMFWVVRAAIFFTVIGTALMVYAFASTHTSVKPSDHTSCRRSGGHLTHSNSDRQYPRRVQSVIRIPRFTAES